MQYPPYVTLVPHYSVCNTTHFHVVRINIKCKGKMFLFCCYIQSGDIKPRNIYYVLFKSLCLFVFVFVKVKVTVL